MNTLSGLYGRMIAAMGVEGLEIPLSAVRFFRHDDAIPDEVVRYETDAISLTSCQASKQSSLGDAVLLTRKNIGCVAAAITFGLVDMNDDSPLSGSRVYTDIMKKQSKPGKKFIAPSPRDFSEGMVYACRESNHPDFCLFGDEDTGRYRSREIAKKAMEDMLAIQPPTTKAVFFYSKDFDPIDLKPDVVTLTVRPVELTRIVQAYQYSTGERVTGSMGAVRVVNSDLIVRPYLTGKINFSSYCIGARLIAEFGPNRLGIGMPFALFEETVRGMEDSRGGYPFHLYPGAASTCR